jgi:hypothetical protein
MACRKNVTVRPASTHVSPLVPATYKHIMSYNVFDESTVESDLLIEQISWLVQTCGY